MRETSSYVVGLQEITWIVPTNADVAGRNSGFTQNRLSVFPSWPAMELQVGLIASTQDHAHANPRRMADFP